MPSSQGGKTTVPCCRACNHTKADLTPPEWAAWRANHPEWWRIYPARMPKQGRFICARNLTQALGKRRVQKAVEGGREKIGVMHGPGRLVIHGWRYTGAVRLAEAGCSVTEIQAVTGRKTLAMVQKYRAAASQKRASKRAQAMVERNVGGT